MPSLQLSLPPKAENFRPELAQAEVSQDQFNCASAAATPFPGITALFSSTCQALFPSAMET
jgi:hypothetical protein